MRKLVAILGCVVLCGVLAPAQTVSFSGRSEDLLIPDKPFQVDYTVTKKRDLPEGNLISYEAQAHLVRDKDGRIRSDAKVVQGGGKKPDVDMTVSFVYDPSAMIQLYWNTKTLQGTTKTLQSGVRYGLTYVSLDVTTVDQNILDKIVPTVKSLGTKQILGLNCSGTLKTIEVPIGKWGNVKPIDVVEETWWSSDLELPVLYIVNNPMYGTLRQEMTKIDRTAPSPDVFKKPEQIEFQTIHPPVLPTTH